MNDSRKSQGLDEDEAAGRVSFLLADMLDDFEKLSARLPLEPTGAAVMSEAAPVVAVTRKRGRPKTAITIRFFRLRSPDDRT